MVLQPYVCLLLQAVAAEWHSHTQPVAALADSTAQDTLYSHAPVPLSQPQLASPQWLTLMPSAYVPATSVHAGVTCPVVDESTAWRMQDFTEPDPITLPRSCPKSRAPSGAGQSRNLAGFRPLQDPTSAVSTTQYRRSDADIPKTVMAQAPSQMHEWIRPHDPSTVSQQSVCASCAPTQLSVASSQNASSLLVAPFSSTLYQQPRCFPRHPGSHPQRLHTSSISQSSAFIPQHSMDFPLPALSYPNSPSGNPQQAQGIPANPITTGLVRRSSSVSPCTTSHYISNGRHASSSTGINAAEFLPTGAHLSASSMLPGQQSRHGTNTQAEPFVPRLHVSATRAAERPGQRAVPGETTLQGSGHTVLDQSDLRPGGAGWLLPGAHWQE